MGEGFTLSFFDAAVLSVKNMYIWVYHEIINIKGGYLY